ncbi:saccharopine dehydrogenase family protein [Rhodococcus koreensis]
MRVAIVGGAGTMGQTVVRTVADFDEVTEILVVDRDIVRSEQIAAEVGPKARVVEFDAKTDSLAPILDGCVAVASTLGPFTVFGLVVLEAAIEAGIHYVDLNDDWEPTIKSLELSERAEGAGITALIGMGASPGLANVLAMRAVAEVDEAQDLVTGWSLAGVEPEEGAQKPAAAIIHLVNEAIGKVRVLEDGREQMVRPLQSFDLDFPGRGRPDIRTVGHPEAITLPRAIPGLRRCINVMSGPGYWFDRLAEQAKRVENGEVTVREAALVIEEPLERPAGTPPTLRMPSIWAWVRGVKDGVKVRVGVGLTKWPATKASNTGIPAALGLQMLIRGEISKRGVVTPEEVVPFDLLMERLTPLYTRPENVADVYSIAVESD